MQLEMKLARKTDPATSHAAASRTKEFRARDISKIYAALKAYGPQTSHELATRTGLTSVAVARRMRELCGKLLIHATHETRPGPSGRECTIWKVWERP